MINPYLSEVHQVLPRLLALFDNDPTSPTLGQGDRLYWGWKLIDFGNGTFQGAVHGLARLVRSGLLPDGMSEASIIRRIGAMVTATAKLQRRDGSLEEAFPHESSFCVTALVSFDLLSAAELLSSRLAVTERLRWLEVVRPMIAFLHRTDETHGIISNHLAVAAAALVKWSALTGERGEVRGKLFLDRILQHASPEGWFREYAGADPGYQTFCLYYLADLHRLRPGLGLQSSLDQSFRFLVHFVHPDGSFGGGYGSRNTRFYCPAAAEALAAEIPEARALAEAMRASVAERRTVPLSVMDEPNLIPMFNAYCWAAEQEMAGRKEGVIPELPCRSQGPWRRMFPQAGLLIDRGTSHYTIISGHKGGVLYHFSSNDPPIIDGGAVARSSSGRLYSTQAYNADNVMRLEDEVVTVTTAMTPMRRLLPSPAKFLLLRVLSLTVMKSRQFGNIFKKLLVYLLVTGGKASCPVNKRTIRLGPAPIIEDSWTGAADLTRLPVRGTFYAIHMASQGYWQLGDDTDDPAS